MKRFRRILFSAGSEENDAAAFSRAVELAASNGAELTVVGAIEASGGNLRSSEIRDALVARELDRLETIVEGIPVHGVKTKSEVFIGKPFVEIIREILRNDYDLLIKAAEGNVGSGGESISGTDLKLLRKCPCPVWLIKSSAGEAFRKILAAVAFGPENPENNAMNRQILEMAGSLALAEKGELHVVHAWNLENEDLFRSGRLHYSEAEVEAMVEEERKRRHQWLRGVVADVCKKLDDEMSPELHLVKGDARVIVPKYVGELTANLVVMGTVARTGISGFILGNTAESVLGQIDTSVLAIKPRGFVSPVTL